MATGSREKVPSSQLSTTRSRRRRFGRRRPWYSRVGKILLRLASEQVLRPSMELGGNAPLIVFDDADLDRAIEGTYAAKMRNGGQSCIAANRIYVQDGIAEAFVEGLTEKMRGVVMGDGLGPGVGLGPLIRLQAV